MAQDSLQAQATNAEENQEEELELEEVVIDVDTASNKKPRLGIKGVDDTWYNFAEEMSDFDLDGMKQKIENHDLRDSTVELQKLKGEDKYANFKELDGEEEKSSEAEEEDEDVLFSGDGEESMDEKQDQIFGDDEDESSDESESNTTTQSSQEDEQKKPQKTSDDSASKERNKKVSKSESSSKPKKKAQDVDDYITYAEALEQAHEDLNNFSINTELVHHDRDGKYYLFKATVIVNPKEGRQQTFQGFGDADPNNVNSMVKKHIPRMAETRAKVRALKDAVGLTGVAKAELEDEDDR